MMRYSREVDLQETLARHHRRWYALARMVGDLVGTPPDPRRQTEIWIMIQNHHQGLELTHVEYADGQA